jgi:hypothetical protein
MGTRNLTVVYLDGEYKVAQYGQWDGQPHGQGLTALRFLRDEMNRPVFEQALRKSSFISSHEMQLLRIMYGEDEVSRVMKEKDYKRFVEVYPQFSRDIGAEVLGLVQENPDGLPLTNNISFAADSLFCEWAWVVDLDRGTFEAHRGFNTTGPLDDTERFAFLNKRAKDGYYPIRKIAEWSLDQLPDDQEFMARFIRDDSKVG